MDCWSGYAWPSLQSMLLVPKLHKVIYSLALNVTPGTHTLSSMTHGEKKQLVLKLKSTYSVTNISNIMQIWFITWAFPAFLFPSSQSLPHVQYVHMRQCDYSCNGFSDSDAHLLPPTPQCSTRRTEVAVMAHSGIPATLCVMMATGHSCLPATSSHSHNCPQLLLFQPQALPPFKALAALRRSSWFHLQKPKLIETFI